MPVPVRELSPEQSLRLLADADFGRIVFSRYALPTIRPVNHVVADNRIIIHANPGTTLVADRQVVAYEADIIDSVTHRGWCVIVTGTAEELTDPDRIAHYRGLLLPWLPGSHDRLIAIEPEIVTGIQLVPPADR
nr:pyridoxamine 5'-phosphate oxidase family protein [Nocardia sp. CC213A]